MNIVSFCDYSINYVFQEKLSLLKNVDIAIFGFKGLNLVNYKKELDGKTEYFRDVATLSKEANCVVICGCDTDSCGVFRHSAVIADRGKILGVTDMAHAIDNSEYTPDGTFRVYDTNAGKIGIIICEDLFFPESARVLTLCDADIIICIYKRVENEMPLVMLRAGAFCNGVIMALCAENYSALSDIKGNIIYAGNDKKYSVDIKIEKDYHLISLRKRGLYKDFKSGY